MDEEPLPVEPWQVDAFADGLQISARLVDVLHRTRSAPVRPQDLLLEAERFERIAAGEPYWMGVAAGLRISAAELADALEDQVVSIGWAAWERARAAAG